MTGRRDIDLSQGSPTLRWPFSQAVVANGMIFLAGQIGVRGTSPQEQAAEAYRRVGHYLAEAGANWVIVHYEACVYLHRTLQLIAHHGMEPAVVVNPATRVDLLLEILPMVHHVLIMSVNPGFGGQEFIPFTLEKIHRLAVMRRELGLEFKIEVDGGVAHDTVSAIVQAGAELLVAGNAVFGAGQPERDSRGLLDAARQAEILQSASTIRDGKSKIH